MCCGNIQVQIVNVFPASPPERVKHMSSATQLQGVPCTLSGSTATTHTRYSLRLRRHMLLVEMEGYFLGLASVWFVMKSCHINMTLGESSKQLRD
jgi:hypothetical protein